MEKASVIVPVYNTQEYLSRCIESLVNQTYTNIEILLVDDCSTDESGRIIEEWAEKDKRIVPILLPKNQGVSAARNRALDEATGEWISFCDGDDWLKPDFFEKMFRCASEENADFVLCNYQIVSDTKMPIPSGNISSLSSGCDNRLVIACGPTASAGHLIRKCLFEQSKVRYPLGCRQYEELPVIPVLAKYATRIGVVNEPLYNYYQRGNGTSASNTGLESKTVFFESWNKMRDALGEGYEEELEYHVIYALFYGEIMRLCKSKADSRMIKDSISEFEKICPDFLSNKYLSELGKAKMLFLRMVKGRFVSGLRLLSCAHSLIVN